MRDTAPAHGRNAQRRAAFLAVAGLGVVAAALALVLGGPGGVTPESSNSPETGATSLLGDLSLVPVPETASAVAVASASGSAAPASIASPASVEAAAQEVRARRIRIERLGIDLRIIEGDGVDAPIGKAAHYPGTAWPGGGSNIYIYGHARAGMFLSLWKARVGDVVELELADRTAREYVVAEVLPRVPWDAVKYLRPTTTEQLTLQTSTSYHPTSPRFIVIAYPAP